MAIPEGFSKHGQGLPSIVDAAERDIEVAEFQSRTHAGMMSRFGAIAALRKSAAKWVRIST